MVFFLWAPHLLFGFKGLGNKGVATPCRVRRKLSFGRAGSQELGKSKSSLSLDSADRGALNRSRTVDSPSPDSQTAPSSSKPKSLPKGSKPDKSPKEDHGSSGPSEKIKEDEPEEDEPEEKKDKEVPKKKQSPAERTRENLRKQKVDKDKKVALVKPKGSRKNKSSGEDGEEGSKKNKEPDQKKKKTETASEKPDEKKDGKQKKNQGKGTEDKSGDQGDLEVAVTEQGKSKAHAMYMKFWRSTRSR